MGNKISICTGSRSSTNDVAVPLYYAPAPVCIPLQCDHKGTSACFVCLNETIYSKLEGLDCDVLDADDQPTQVNFIDILNELRKNNVCLKVFKFFKSTKADYKEELKGIGKLEQCLNNDETLNKYTTYRKIHGAFGFTFKFKTKVIIMDGIRTNTVHVLFQEQCQSSLKEYEDKNNVDAKKLLDDVTPVLRAIHSKGYAHMDIKLQNIVLCNDVYKLIDFGMVDKDAKEIRFTDEFCSPLLFKYYNGQPENNRILQQYLHEYEQSGNRFEELCYNEQTYMYNDQYALAVCLLHLDAKNKEEYITKLLQPELYFLKDHVGGKPVVVTKSGHIDLAGRRRVLYKTARGKQYVRMGGRLVAVAEVRRRVPMAPIL